MQTAKVLLHMRVANYCKSRSENTQSAESSACLFNNMFTTHQDLDLGGGTLVPCQKPGKTVGPPGHLRPIVLLTSLRKTLSIIKLGRISSKVSEYLSPTQSGFSAGRSTATLVWSHGWFAATCQHYRRGNGPFLESTCPKHLTVYDVTNC